MNQSRRNFLKWMGVLANGTLLPACQAKVEKLIPFLNKPEGYMPGEIMEYYSFLCNELDFAEVMVKNQDNHPVKVEGNSNSPVNNGGLNARLQASLFDFYHSERIQKPQINGKEVSLLDLDDQIKLLLEQSKVSGREVWFVHPYLVSPTEQKAVSDFVSFNGNVRSIQLGRVSYASLAEANESVFATKAIPSFQFDHARLVVSFQCNFLAGWLNPIKNASQYASAKRHFGASFQHIQFESVLSLTGSNATMRRALTSEEINDLVTQLHALCFQNEYQPRYDKNIQQASGLFHSLKENKGSCLVVYGGDDSFIHEMVLELNAYFETIGNTVYPQRADKTSNPLPSEFGLDTFQGQLPETILFYRVSPFEGGTMDDLLEQRLLQIPNRIYVGDTINEIMKISTMVVPSHHHLECWSDAQPNDELLCLGQPVFHPLYESRTAGEYLLKWMNNEQSWPSYMREHWENNFLPLCKEVVTLEQMWEQAQATGHVMFAGIPGTEKNMQSSTSKMYPERVKTENFELHVFLNSKTALNRSGSNYWLKELADPVSKVCWDHYFTMHPEDLSTLGAADPIEGDTLVLAISLDDETIKAPVLPSKEQAPRTIGMALNKMKQPVLIQLPGDAIQLLSGHEQLAQIHRTTSLPKDYLTLVDQSTVLERADLNAVNEKWLMLVDLDQCNGCSACVIACRGENNIPVVGKEEILKKRSLDWMQIERYQLAEDHYLHLPKMCQHCDQAPCESICPVLATTQSRDGLNQMVYNRCVGTRYCAANCVYEVRQFNWFNYRKKPFDQFNPTNANMSRLLLNPDVTVRTRGVMEKCNFCQHRIQREREQAKAEGRKMQSDQAQPACAQTCPSKAIQLINLNDPDDHRQLAENEKFVYQMHVQYHTLPSVVYLSNRQLS